MQLSLEDFYNHANLTVSILLFAVKKRLLMQNSFFKDNIGLANWNKIRALNNSN